MLVELLYALVEGLLACKQPWMCAAGFIGFPFIYVTVLDFVYFAWIALQIDRPMFSKLVMDTIVNLPWKSEQPPSGYLGGL